MIGNIIYAVRLKMDALLEIEDALEIRIIHRGGSVRTDSSRHFSSSLGVSGGSSGGTASQVTGANNNNLSVINHGLMGLIYVVYQLLTENSGYRWRDTNPVEYLYGCLALMTGSHSYNPSRQEAHEEKHFPVSTTVNTQLIPDGPLADTHARTQQRLYPLI